jgi:hypothetical protein
VSAATVSDIDRQADRVRVRLVDDGDDRYLAIARRI